PGETDRRVTAVVRDRRRRAPPRRIEASPAERKVGARLGQVADAAGQAEAQMVRALAVAPAVQQPVPRDRVAERGLPAFADLMLIALRRSVERRGGEDG